MKLDRDINDDGLGKYALVLLRKLHIYRPSEPFGESAVLDALDLLLKEGLIDKGIVGTESEFFLIRLKDRHARPALLAYADSIHGTDPEFAAAVRDMAARSGELSPFCKEPD